jgi:ABC-type transport system involved in multi-copper enzyme maturation permease subunit
VRLLEVFRFEVEYVLRRFATWIYGAGLFGLAFLIIVGLTDRPDPVIVNSPQELAAFAVLVSMIGMLITAALFGDAALRDVETGMEPFLLTSPIAKAEYLGGRFLAALVLNALLFAAIPLGQAAATLILSQSLPKMFGPFQAAAFLQPYVLLLLPNLVLVGAVLFTIAIVARQVIPVYLGAIVVFISYLLAVSLWNELENPLVSTFIDPLGMAVLMELSRYKTEAERNTMLVGFPAALVGNRVLWLSMAVLMLCWLGRVGQVGRVGRVGLDGQVGRVGRASGALPALPARPALAIACRSLAEMTISRVFLAVLVILFGLTTLFAWEAGDSVFDTSTWPVTILVVERLLDTPLTPITFLLTAVYAGELVWKEREIGMAEIADATPVSESAALVGRFLALVVILALLQVPIIAAGVLLQAVKEYYHFEIGLYVRLLFGLNLSHLVILAALAMTIHVVASHKYLGNILVVMACVVPVAAAETGLVRHNLLLYGADPGWVYSNMNGFGPFIGPFVWFKVYWAAWALLLAVIASLFWVRGREPGVRVRLREARARFAGAARRMAGAAGALILVFGGFIFYNTNILNGYRAPEDAGRARAEYEKRYSRYKDLPQPAIVSADLRIEIYPEERAVDLSGSYRLVNQTGGAIDSVHVMFGDPGIEARSMSFDRAARAVVVDDEASYRIFALERALAPGEAIHLTFDVAFRPRGFPNTGIQTVVAGNGTYLDRRFLPLIGYQPANELESEEERRRFGLAPQPPLPAQHDKEATRLGSTVQNEDLVHVNAIVGTAGDQTAVTLGVLRKTWAEKGRRYFQYENDTPFSLGTFFSARYAALEDRWNDVDLRIFHHPTHTYVLDRTMRSMKASLEYYTTQFGPYPDKQLRILEIPRYGGFGRAHPHTISFTEDHFLSRVRAGEIDQPFYGTAHEIAHQWWPGQVMGARVRGHGFLSESLANYSAMMVTEKTYGLDVARRVYDFQMQRYLNGRAFQSREVPLLDVGDQPYIAYRKGAIAIYTLREHIGEERVNMALRRYLEKHRGAGRRRPYATSLDLYAELRAVTPDSFESMLKDWFEEITLWDVRATRAVVEPAGSGEYQVTLDLVAKKLRADSVGKETEVPMDEPIEIGAFANGETIYLQRHRIRSGEQTIRITVPRTPTRAGVDPYRKLIDRRRDDNVAAVAERGSQSITMLKCNDAFRAFFVASKCACSARRMTESPGTEIGTVPAWLDTRLRTCSPLFSPCSSSALFRQPRAARSIRALPKSADTPASASCRRSRSTARPSTASPITRKLTATKSASCRSSISRRCFEASSDIAERRRLSNSATSAPTITACSAKEPARQRCSSSMPTLDSSS